MSSPSSSPSFEARLGLATAGQAQQYLSLSRTSLWRLERRGALIPVRLGRTLRYRWADIQRLAAGGAK